MPQLAYYWDDADYYTHSEPCTTDPLESAKQGRDVYVLGANGCLDAPTFKDGKWPRRVNGAWVDVENHVGEKGYINGVPTENKEYGPLPEGWSDTPPAPTTEELFDRLRSVRDARISAVLWVRERHADELGLGKETTLTPEQYTALLTYIQALRDLPAQPGAPWDGGGELTPCPELPSVK